MTREEIEQKINQYKLEKELLNGYIKQDNELLKDKETRIVDLEKQLAELEVEVYRSWIPKQGQCFWYINVDGGIIKWYDSIGWEKTIKNSLLGIFPTEEQAKQSYDRHMAGEELKKLISEENAKQGWKVDWKMGYQKRYFIVAYSQQNKELSKTRDVEFQSQENELYFSEKSAGNKDFLEKIKPLWLKWKGIE